MTHLRVAVLSIDALGADLLWKFVDEGELPAFSKLISSGAVVERLKTTLPPTTAPAHAAAITGCYPVKTGITGNLIFEPSTDRAFMYSYTAFGLDSRSLLVEPAWCILEKQGFSQLVIGYPLSWPPPVRNVVGAYFNYDLHLKESQRLKVPLKDGEGFFKVGESSISLKAGGHGVMLACSGRKEQLEVGGWSSWLPTSIKGSKGFFRLKLLRLEEGLAEIYVSEIFKKLDAIKGELASKLMKGMGIYPGAGDGFGLYQQRIDLELFEETLEEALNWTLKTFLKALTSSEWDILWFYTPLLDTAQHAFGIEGNHTKHFYKLMDEMVARALEHLPEDVCLVIYSDHGMTKVERELRVNVLLKKLGYQCWRDTGKGYMEVDLQRSQTLFVDPCHIFILSGGDAKERILQDLKKELSKLRDPWRGERVCRVMEKEEALKYGLGGRRAGDLILIPEPDCHSTGIVRGEEPLSVVPTYFRASHETHPSHPGMDGILMMYGDKIASKSLKRAKIVDLAPTIFELLGVRGHGGMDGRPLSELLK